MSLIHSLGIEFPPIPFLWNYNDFANPFPSLQIDKIDKNKFIKIIGNDNVALHQELDTLFDNNTDFYIHVQYKEDKYIYEGGNDDIYLGYHSWCYCNHMKKNVLEIKKGKFYLFKSALYSLVGDIEHSDTFPNKGTHKKNRPGGIDINSNSKGRSAVIHNIHSICRFSSVGVCNFKLKEENYKFVSVGRNFTYKKQNICNNVVVLHVFRNVMDSDYTHTKFIKLYKGL
jgi:hypothetical protein